MAENKKTSVVDDTFKEIDEKFSILSEESKNWIKQKLLFHISEAYERGKKEQKQKKIIFFIKYIKKVKQIEKRKV